MSPICQRLEAQSEMLQWPGDPQKTHQQAEVGKDRAQLWRGKSVFSAEVAQGWREPVHLPHGSIGGFINSVANHSLANDPAISLLWLYAMEMNAYPKTPTGIFPAALCSQELQMSVNFGMEKETVVYLHNGMLYYCKKKKKKN